MSAPYVMNKCWRVSAGEQHFWSGAKGTQSKRCVRGRGSCSQQFVSLVPFIINLTGSVSCQKTEGTYPYQSVTNSKIGGEINDFWRFNLDLTMENGR